MRKYPIVFEVHLMPQVFEECVATKGSKKFTKSLPGGKYVHGCKRPGAKKAVWGEVHTKQKIEGL